MAETSAPASQPSSRSGNAAFIFILVMVAFDMVAFGIIAPVLPDLIRQFEGGDFGRASDLTGYLLLVWNAMQFLFSPILGAWSDRIGWPPHHSSFLFWIRRRLHRDGPGSNASVAIHRAHYFGDHGLEYFDGFCLCH